MSKAAEGRTIEVITGELLEAKQAGGEAILTIGRCLIEAKESLPHGEWLPWLNERAELSERAAQRFMRLAREWSNPTALSDLGATKAITLLALPAEEREQFMEEHNVIDMTTRQLEQAIKDRDEARKAASAAQDFACLISKVVQASELEAKVRTVGVTSCLIERKAGSWRHQILLSGTDVRLIVRVVRKALGLWKEPSGVHLEIDVDPLSLL